LAFYLGYLVIFPTKDFAFYPPAPDAAKNTIVDPRTSQTTITKDGQDENINNLLFDAVSPVNYSAIQIDLALNKKSPLDKNITVEVRKSHQAFLYPEGNPIGFKDGSLVKNEDSYFIISQGKERKFVSDAIISGLGYDKGSFIEIGNDDLKYNEKGDDIDSLSYPDGAIFKINDLYYILENQKLKKFVSTQAYLTQYDDRQALAKNEDFMNNYPLDDNLAGFADGTLISYGISAFIVSSGQVLPIDNPNTFLSDGYQWSDIIPVSGDELSLYQKAKLFNISSPHPNGTIMETSDKNKWYMIKDGQKDLLPTPAIVQSWSKRNPVVVSETGLTPIGNCQPKEGLLNSRNFSCVIPIENSADLIGIDYEFRLASDSNTKIDAVNISFQKTVNSHNFKSAVLGLISKIKGNYVPQTPAPIQ
jgi:hypothetical protein